MSWNYNATDLLPPAPSGAGRVLVGQQVAAVVYHEPTTPEGKAAFLQAAQDLSAQYPEASAAILSNPALSPERKLELMREFVQLDQSASISDATVASTSAELRAVAASMKQEKEQEAQQIEQAANMLIAPVAALAAPAAIGARAPETLALPLSERREASLAEALDFVRERGPDATPGIGAARGIERG